MNDINELILEKIIKSLKLADEWNLCNTSPNFISNAVLGIVVVGTDNSGSKQNLGKSRKYMFYKLNIDSYGNQRFTETLPIKMNWWDRIRFSLAIRTQLKLIDAAVDRKLEKLDRDRLLKYINSNQSLKREMNLDKLLDD